MPAGRCRRFNNWTNCPNDTWH